MPRRLRLSTTRAERLLLCAYMGIFLFLAPSVCLWSANILAVSRRQLLKAILMMEFAEDRPRNEPHGPGESMADDLGGRQSGRYLRESGAEAGVRAAAIIIRLPKPKNPRQMVLPSRNEEVQALSP